MIEIYLLEHLVGIAQYQTLAEAAEHLHVTQPTLTRSIQKMEQQLGVQLFRREKNRIYINKNGELARDYAQKILALETQMEEAVKALDRKQRIISIGACAPAPNLLLEPVLRAQYPDTPIKATLQTKEVLYRGLRHGEFQMIVLAEPLEVPKYCCQKFGTEHLRLSVLPAHPCASMKSVSFADINEGSFLVYQNLGVWEDIVRKHMPNARFLMQSEMDAYAEVVNASSLPTFDTNWASRFYHQSVNRISIPIRDTAAHMTFYAIYPENTRRIWERVLAVLNCET